MKTEAYWQVSACLPHFDSLASDLEVDVAIIGGGLTGITAAYLLKNAGAKVALIERNRCACCDTGHTTAHLAYVTDERLHHLVKVFGRDAAKVFWQAGMAAIDQIHDIVRGRRIDCDFKWVPGYLHAALNDGDKKDHDLVQQDAELARELRFEAEFIKEVPYARKPGVHFPHQAKFHPMKYLGPLLESIPGDGSHVFENTEAGEIEGKPLTVHAGKHKLRCST